MILSNFIYAVLTSPDVELTHRLIASQLSALIAILV